MCLSYRYDLPQGCGGKLPGAVLRPLGVLWYPGEYLGCRKYQTGNQCTKLLLHPSGKTCTNKPQICRAYKYGSQRKFNGGSLMAGIGLITIRK